MKCFIEIWKAKDAWMELSKEERGNYVGQIDPHIQGILERGVENLEWCFQHGHRPADDEIYVWNEFVAKRGWRDSGSGELAQAKRELSFGDRDDIQTWFELHLADEA